jgi:5-methyltetrahydrofolate--homocysteine methyltransferase
VPVDEIIKRAKEEKVDIIGLSGLITPSLDEMVYNVKEFTKKGINVPVLIGGATTSKLHTAAKIAPCYHNGPVVHVLDASRAVVVINSLTDQEYIEEINEEYKELREDYFENMKDKVFLSLKDARKKKKFIDWRNQTIPKPPKLGVTYLKDYNISELIPYINWSPFFSTWQLRGRYPHRGYPNIFNDPKCGEEAKKLYEKATQMLDDIVNNQLLTAQGVVAFYPCNTVDEDDIELYSRKYLIKY